MLLESDFATSKASPDTDKDSGCYYCSSVEEDVHAVPWFAALGAHGYPDFGEFSCYGE